MTYHGPSRLTTVAGGAAGGSGGNYMVLPILGFLGDATNPTYLEFSAAQRPYMVLAYHASTDYLASIGFRMPDNYSTGLKTLIQYSMAGVTGSRVIQFRQEIMAIADTENVTTDGYGSVENSAAIASLATATEMDEATIATSTTIAAGDYISLRFGRENTVTSGTNEDNDIRVWTISLTWTAA